MKIQGSYDNKVLFAKTTTKQKQKKITLPFQNTFKMAKLQMEETKQEEVIWEGQEVEESQRPHETSETDRRLVHPAQTSAETECDETDIDAKKTSPWS